MGSNLDQKFKLWVRPASVKIRVFQNNLIGICPTMQTTCDQSVSSVYIVYWNYCLKTKNIAKPIGFCTKKSLPSCFFRVMSRTVNTQKLNLAFRKYRWMVLLKAMCENFWWPFGSSLGDNLQSICIIVKYLIHHLACHHW